MRATRPFAGLALACLVCCGLPSVEEFAGGPGADAPDAAAEAAPIADAAAAADAFVPSLSIDPPVIEDATTIDLDTEGPLDWQVWSDPVNRCAACAPWFGSLVPAGTTLDPYRDDPRTFSWKNGAPEATGSLRGGVLVAGLNVSMTLPFTARDRRARITLHTDVFHAAGVLTASFAGDEDGPSISVPLGDVRYRFVIRVDAPGKLVNIVWKVTGVDTSEYANVALSAATVRPE